VLGRICNTGYIVVDRPRPRCAGAGDLSVNHNLDRVAVFQEPISVISTADAIATTITTPINCYGLVLHDTGPTHQLGGTLDGTVGRPGNVAVGDVGLSDHFLLKWEVAATRTASYSTVVQSLPWSHINVESNPVCRCSTSTRWWHCTTAK